MKWIIYLLLFSIFFALLGLWYLQDPGNITITWLGYEIQFSVLASFVFLIILCFMTFIFLRLYYRFRSMCCYSLSFFLKQKDKKENGAAAP
jgi:uncharacterized protein HemY